MEFNLDNGHGACGENLRFSTCLRADPRSLWAGILIGLMLASGCTWSKDAALVSCQEYQSAVCECDDAEGLSYWDDECDQAIAQTAAAEDLAANGNDDAYEIAQQTCQDRLRDFESVGGCEESDADTDTDTDTDTDADADADTDTDSDTDADTAP